MTPRHRSRLAAALLATLLLGGCASRGAVPRPFPTPRDPAATVEAPAPGASENALAVLQTALSLRGAPYRLGGADPQGFDCSGFVQYVFWQHGIALPRTVDAQADAGARVDGLQPGDLLFFAVNRRSVSHVGIALGPDRFVHAPSSTGVVRVELLHSPYWASRLKVVRRVLAD